MSRLTVQGVLIIACTLTTLAECARQLPDAELSMETLSSQLVEAPRSAHLRSSQLSPAQRTHNRVFRLSVYHTSPSPNEEYEVIGDRGHSRTSVEESNRKAEHLHRQLYTFNSVLHKNPAGPNPIGNEYGPSNTIHNVKKYRYPPQG